MVCIATCDEVGRGTQPRSTPQLPPHSQTYTKSIQNACFSTFQLDHYGPTDGPTERRTDGRVDKASYIVACPQLKIFSDFMPYCTELQNICQNQ